MILDNRIEHLIESDISKLSEMSRRYKHKILSETSSPWTHGGHPSRVSVSSKSSMTSIERNLNLGMYDALQRNDRLAVMRSL